MRKLNLILLLSLLATAGLAQAAGFVCTPDTVTIPCARTAWDVALEGLWVEATNDDLNYDSSFDIGHPDRTTNYFVDPNYEWGFRLQGSYHFSTGKDVVLDWLYYDQAENANYQTQKFSQGFPVVLANVNGRAEFDFSQANLEFGQHLDVGKKVDMRVHVGAEYARLDHVLSSEATVPTTPPLVPQDEGFWTRRSWHSKTTGIGPRAGLDFFYHMHNGLSLVGRFAAAALVSKIDSHFHAKGTLVNPPQYKHMGSGGERHTVLPVLQSRLGLNYARPVKAGTASIEVGYQVNNVLHSVIHPSVFYGQQTGLSLRNHISNFGLHGAYLTLKYLT